ncbi:MAG: helix-turn-helix domain-containing protein, partial [Saprospiraceae bacterium]
VHSGINKDIFWNVYQSGFFIYNEFIYLLFNLTLLLLSLRLIHQKAAFIKGSTSVQKNWQWLAHFTWSFLIVTLLNLLHQLIANLFSLEHSGRFYQIILVINAIYIYWIGYISFTKTNHLFKIIQIKKQDIAEVETATLIKIKLEKLLVEQEVFTRKELKVADLAIMVDLNEKELSNHIHETYQQSFADFINTYRVEKVKALLLADAHEKYTLVALAEQAGFRSKSTFNAVFKKLVGMTPTQYKKAMKGKE